MEIWAGWVSKLLSCAALRAPDAPSFRTLSGAADDAAALRDALSVASIGCDAPGQSDVLRSIYDLWDANQDRIELLAATVDPEWHRTWGGRSATARLRPAPTWQIEQPPLAPTG